MWSGTSMAAPIAAGVAALVKATNPSFIPHQVVERLIDTGVEWDCFSSVRGGDIRTSRINAKCALDNNVACGNAPQACQLPRNTFISEPVVPFDLR